MSNLLDKVMTNWRWPAFALAASLAMLGAAHAFERFAYMAPCPLCLRQREVYWAVVAMTVTALILWQWRRNRRFMMAFNVMLGLVFLTGAVVAAFHAGVEWKFWPAPEGCTVEIVDVTAIDLGSLDERQAVVSCTEAPWSLFGLSMAGWNAVVSMGLSLLSFQAARIVGRQPAAF